MVCSQLEQLPEDTTIYCFCLLPRRAFALVRFFTVVEVHTSSFATDRIVPSVSVGPVKPETRLYILRYQGLQNKLILFVGARLVWFWLSGSFQGPRLGTIRLETVETHTEFIQRVLGEATLHQSTSEHSWRWILCNNVSLIFGYPLPCSYYSLMRRLETWRRLCGIMDSGRVHHFTSILNHKWYLKQTGLPLRLLLFEKIVVKASCNGFGMVNMKHQYSGLNLF